MMLRQKVRAKMASPRKASVTWMGSQILSRMGARVKGPMGTVRLSETKRTTMGVANEKRTDMPYRKWMMRIKSASPHAKKVRDSWRFVMGKCPD